jgi:uncharacterized membrane protein
MVHTVSPALAEPFAYAALAVALAAIAWRLDWRGLAESAAIAGLAGVAALLGPAVAGAALLGRMSSSDLAAAGFATAAAQALAWWLAARRPRPLSVEALSTTAVISLLLTLFLLLSLLGRAGSGSAARLDGFAQAGLRTTLLLIAGLVLTVRGGATPLGRARGPVILGLGAAHGLLVGMLVFNPWWGIVASSSGLSVSGPPLFDTIAVGYLAPALLLIVVAWRRVSASPRIARYAAYAAAVFAMAWALTEVRRLFHSPRLAVGTFGYAEMAAYGVVSLAVLIAGTRAWSRRMSGVGIGTSRHTVAWIGLAVSAWIVVVTASPWWGPLEGAFHQPILFFILNLGAIALTALVGRPWTDKWPAPILARASLATSIVEGLSLITLLIRFGFHGEEMRLPLPEASVETWSYSAAWAFCGLGVLIIGVRARDQVLRWLGLAVLLATTLKVFFFDMANLTGVIRAGSFMLLGALLIIGAFLARRLGAAAVAPRD